jgi:hypothetical protein
VAKPHELFGQTRNDPFGASVETRRNALHEGSDLCDFHDDLYFPCVNANVLFLRKCERARCKQVPVCRREQRARRDPPLRLATLRFEFPCPSSVQTIPPHWRCLQPLSKTYAVAPAGHTGPVRSANLHFSPVHRRQKATERLRRLLEKSKAKVVLSSTWRYDPVGLFAAKYWGVPFIDVTPDMPRRPRRPRRDEIAAWLKKHPNVRRFVVIDDDDDELDDLPLFQPSPDTGLTSEISEAACTYLAGKSDQDMRCAPVKRLLQNVRSVLQGHPG